MTGDAHGRDAVPVGVAGRPTLAFGLSALAGMAVLGAAMLAALLMGPLPIPAGAIVRDVLDGLPFVSVDSGLTAQQHDVLWQLRMPRVVLGALVGATLALGGAAYQGTFRNPLADPYLLGVAAGAGLGATVSIVYAPGLSIAGQASLPVFAFAGGLVAVALALVVGRSFGEGRTSTTLILGGVAVASFLTALQTFVQQSHDETLQQVYGWILGRLSTSGWTEVRVILPYVLLAAVVVLAHGRLLDVLALGDDAAESLGVNAGRVRGVVVVCVTMATAAAVAVSGLIGFVGIVVPHAVRLCGVRGHRALLPLSAVAGAAFLVACDLVARTVMEPAELPIGVVTALIGAPAFALVLRASRGGATP